MEDVKLLATQPQTYDDLRDAIATRHVSLSKRLQQIAAFALANPNDMALETVATVAQRAGIQPSALIRFAKTFGYSGFSDMQRVFQTRLVTRVPSYSERIRQLKLDEHQSEELPHVLQRFVESGIRALQHLRDEVEPALFERAVGILAEADAIYLMSQRRAFPVSCYLAYGLSGLGLRPVLIDGVGGMTRQQADGLRPGDALIAVSFRPYSPETIDVARSAKDAGVPIIAITDDSLSPLRPLATVTLEVEDAQVRSFRSLTATMCLAMSLVVGLGSRLDNRTGAPTKSGPAA